jgi:hypothetical protein
MKRVGLSEKDAAALMSGKRLPAAKGKKRRTEIAADTALEGKMSEHVAKHKIPKSEVPVFSGVRGGSLKGVMSETMARVYEEIWPGMKTHDEYEGEVDLEISEEAYILMLTMKVGNDKDSPRKGLAMKEIEGFGDSLPACRECA